jgi:hypothetical protein
MAVLEVAGLPARQWEITMAVMQTSDRRPPGSHGVCFVALASSIRHTRGDKSCIGSHSCAQVAPGSALR